MRDAAPGHFYDVITNGFGTMPDYASQVPPADRWAIVAYLRALQISENATLADVPPARRAELERAPLGPLPAAPPPSGGLAPADPRFDPAGAARPTPAPSAETHR